MDCCVYGCGSQFDKSFFVMSSLLMSTVFIKEKNPTPSLIQNAYLKAKVAKCSSALDSNVIDILFNYIMYLEFLW